VRAAVRGAGSEAVESGIDDGMLKYLSNPKKYNPSKGSLPGWLATIGHTATSKS
jgi:hypothetical protein